MTEIAGNGRLAFRFVTIWTKGCQIREECLYFVLPDDPDFCKEVSKMEVSFGFVMPASFNTMGMVHGMIYQESWPQVYHILYDIFFRFRSFSDKLHEHILYKRPLLSIFSLLEMVTDNPWYLADASYHVLYARDDKDAEDMSYIWRYLYQKRYLPVDIISELVRSGGLDEMNNHKKAYIPDKDPFTIPFVSNTICPKDTVVGHFYIIGFYHPPSVVEVEIAQFFGSVLEQIYESYREMVPTYGRIYDNYFLDLLEGKAEVSTERTHELLNMLGFGQTDRLLLAVTEAKEDFLNHQGIIDRLKLPLIEERFFCRCFPYHNRLVILFNLTMSCQKKGYHEKDFFREFSREFLKDSYLAGLSDTFRADKELPFLRRYYLQANSALSAISEKSKPYLFYEQIAIKGLFDEIKKNLPDGYHAFSHPAISILKDYDKLHDTELLKTLKCYYLCNRNMVHTASRLFIHRNTLMNRMDKIKALTAIDPADYDTGIRLMILFSLED